MPMIRNLPTAWSAPVTLAADEVWQVRGGPVFISTDASPDALGGIEFNNGDTALITSGKQVRYRSFDATAQIARDSF